MRILFSLSSLVLCVTPVLQKYIYFFNILLKNTLRAIAEICKTVNIKTVNISM